MSLVGSLEDLGLGDILQIVSLSRKSGLLLLRSDNGDGRIVFQDGLVRAAHVKGEPDDLRGLLVPGGFADASDIDLAIETARESGLPAAEVIAERTALSMERIDSLRREQVERSVLCMFTWRVGEFSFEVRNAIDDRDLELSLQTGINAQYLMMEATRLGDEGRGGEQAPAPEQASPPAQELAEEEFVFSGEGSAGEGTVTLPGGVPDADAPEDAREALALATAAAVDADPAGGAGSEGAGEEVAAAAFETRIAEDASAGRTPPAAASDPQGGSAALVVLDPELRALEWIKSVLCGLFKRIHIFQSSDAAVGRIRQYLGRGELPTVLVSWRIPADSTSGGGVAGLLRRLRAQAPCMPVLVMHEGAEPTQAGADAADCLVVRPPTAALADRRRREQVRAAADELRAALTPWAERSVSPTHFAPSPRVPAAGPSPELQRLRDISGRLRDPATRGEVLTLVLEFAAENFSRVAMFMVRDDVAVGIAQRGLPVAGGPDDERFRELQVPLDEPVWFCTVIEGRQPLRAAPSGEGDRRLWARLGSSAPREAYVAPIESGGRVAALLYADNLPHQAPMGDATALAIVLHEAGLALDRALLERALAAERDS